MIRIGSDFVPGDTLSALFNPTAATPPTHSATTNRATSFRFISDPMVEGRATDNPLAILPHVQTYAARSRPFTCRYPPTTYASNLSKNAPASRYLSHWTINA